MAPPTTTGTSPVPRTAQRGITIRGCTHEVARARRFVTRILGPDHPGTEVAVLLTSELVTNAVLHSDSRGGGSVRVAITQLAGWLRVEVTDAGSARSTPEVKDTGCVSNGHGLFLVNALAQAWGYYARKGQTTVWFSLTW